MRARPEPWASAGCDSTPGGDETCSSVTVSLFGTPNQNGLLLVSVKCLRNLCFFFFFSFFATSLPRTPSSATAPVHMTSDPPESDFANRLGATVVCFCFLCAVIPEIDCIFKKKQFPAKRIFHCSLCTNLHPSIYFFHSAIQLFCFCAGQLFSLLPLLPFKGVDCFGVSFI